MDLSLYRAPSTGVHMLLPTNDLASDLLQGLVAPDVLDCSNPALLFIILLSEHGDGIVRAAIIAFPQLKQLVNGDSVHDFAILNHVCQPVQIVQQHIPVLTLLKSWHKAFSKHLTHRQHTIFSVNAFTVAVDHSMSDGWLVRLRLLCDCEVRVAHQIIII